MKIHKEGFLIIAFAFVIISFLSFISIALVPFAWLTYFLIFGFSVVFLWVVLFFRVPLRKINYGNHILATADGEVVAIEEVTEKEHFKERRIMVSVFMSPFNVHVNWYPFSGTVTHVEYHPGKFLFAHHPKSSELNERNSIVLEKEPGKDILIRQVAGIMARRIICYSKPGDTAVQGKELGIIRFGSRVDFFLPIGTEIKVQMNQKVKAQQTVIGQFKE
ncbi:MAG TPA: phosphatidylserine decarboxylase family protein [Bacteroidales bacterium]